MQPHEIHHTRSNPMRNSRQDLELSFALRFLSIELLLPGLVPNMATRPIMALLSATKVGCDCPQKCCLKHCVLTLRN